MLRLSAEQRTIMGCYSGTREERIKKMIIALPFIEDNELREMMENLLRQIEKIGDDEFVEETEK